MVLLGASIQSILAEEFLRLPADPRAVALETVEHMVHEYHLDAIEIFLDAIFLYPSVVDRELFTQVADLQERLGFTLTAHLPFVWVDISSGNELTRAASIEAITQAVTMTSPLEVVSYVLHATGPFANEVAAGATEPEENLWIWLTLRGIDRSLAELRSRLPDVPLAVETLEAFPFDWQAPLVKQHGLGVCCDVAHLVARGEDPIPFVEEWLPQIRSFHIHGVRDASDRSGKLSRRDHQALGGPDELVDAGRLLTLLDQRGFNGPVILENLSRADLEASLGPLFVAAGRNAPDL